MLAGEVKRPRTYLKNAFKVTYFRFAFFFIGSALCVGIVVPYNDKTLLDILSGTSEGAGTAAASPYVIAMRNLGVTGLPHLTNALLCTSIFSAGNAYVYYGSRSLYSLALDGHAPNILRKCTKSGVPIYCLYVTMIFPCLGFLNVSSGTAKVLGWFTNMITGAQILDYISICITYLFFYRATQAQGINRHSMPYYAYFQPYSTWFALIFISLVLIFYGYGTFLPGAFTAVGFLTYYLMPLLAPILFLGFKFVKRTHFVKPLECDLLWQKAVIDAYEESYNEPPVGFWTEIAQMFGFKKNKRVHKA